MMRNPCFGRWISHSISYGLASSNKKAARILAKAMISKIDGSEFLPYVAGGTTTSPSNTIHDEFQYSAFASFLKSHCSIDIDIPFIVKHKNAIRLLTENENSIWDENIRIELNEFKDDVEDIILPAKHHGQQVEQGVQLTALCTGSGRNESCTSAMVVVKSYDHQKITMQHTKELNTKQIRPNQHMNKDRVSVSEGSKRKLSERQENGMVYQTHSQATKEKAKLFIDLARVDSYFEAPAAIRKKMLDIARSKRRKLDSVNTMEKIRQQQKIESLTKSMQKNEQRKSGERRGKPRLATDIAMVDLTKPTSETQNMAINKFIKRAQKDYIIEEILTLRSYATPNEELEGQEGHEIAMTHGRIELKELGTIEEVKRELRKVLGLNPLDRSMDSTTMFKIQSEKSKAIGGAGKLIAWNDTLEQEYISRNTT